MVKKLPADFRRLPLSARLCILMTFIFFLSLIPLIHLGLYSHAAGDDYAYGLLAHLAWRDTRSLPAVIQAALENTKNYYESWQGTYSSIFFMSLQPSVLSDRLYFTTAIIMLIMLVGSHFLFFRTLFTRYFRLDKALWISLAVAVLTLSIQILDSAGAAFFWFNGAVHYVFMHGCMIFLLSFLLLSLKAEKKWKLVFYALLSGLLGFVTGGSNYVTALLTPVLVAMIFALCLFFKSRRAPLCLFPLAVSLMGLGINVAAPGNTVRMSTQIAPLSAPEAIYQSFIYAIKGIGTWTTVYVIFFVVLLLPFLFSALYRTESDFDFPLPGLVCGFSFCLIAASYTPSLYSMGHVIIFERTLNIMRMLYYLLLFLNLFYLTGWLTARLRRYGGGRPLLPLLGQLRQRCARSFCLSMAAFFLVILIFSNPNDVTTLSAMDSLYHGYAKSYHEESLNRIALLSMEGVDEVWVPNFSVCPPLLNPQILSEDPQEYPNPTIAQWYGKTTLHFSVIY